jgi:anaerobic selenocysteine-containing dehydrogenase
MAADADDDQLDEPDLELTDLPHSAGGLPATWTATRYVARDAGLIAGTRALIAMNQPDGFDCPGCAWPEPAADVRHRIEFCENGAKALGEEAMAARATPELFARATVDELRALSDFELGHLGRLTHPMVLDHTRRYRAISWDAALRIIADEMRAAGPAATALYTSGRCSNEAAFLYQLVARMFGTNNLPDCSNMCHESSGVALGEVIGVGKGTVSLADFDHADLILVVGQNPGTNHPRMLTTLRECAKRGATIISINPLREVGLVRFAHPQLPLDVLAGGTELAREHIDRAFLAARSDGFAAWRAHAEAASWDAITRGSGVDEETIRRLAARYATAKRVITCWAMGLTQHKHADATIQEIVNVMLLRGNIGRPGAGLCPVRGHSNVQGDRTMGIDHLPKPAFLHALGTACGFAPPATPGLDVVDTIRAIELGAVRAVMFLGGNFVSASPDTERTARALEKCTLTASVATKLNRTHLYPGARALLLPCLGRSEVDVQATGAQFVTVEDSMSMVHRSQGVLPPASPELRSEPAIIAGLGAALLGAHAQPWDAFAADYDTIRELIARVVPGFADFNARVRTPSGFQLPNVGRDGTFANTGGRARFTVSALPELALPAGRLRMMTIRSHDQYNTTIYGHDDRYRGVRGGRRVVFMSSADMVERHLVERQVVDLVSEWDDGERVAEHFVVVPYELPRGNCATYFPEANALVPLDSVADKSNTPTSKSVIVRIVPRPRA